MHTLHVPGPDLTPQSALPFVLPSKRHVGFAEMVLMCSVGQILPHRVLCLSCCNPKSCNPKSMQANVDLLLSYLFFGKGMPPTSAGCRKPPQLLNRGARGVAGVSEMVLMC